MVSGISKAFDSNNDGKSVGVWMRSTLKSLYLNIVIGSENDIVVLLIS